jgi:hypothetical protein
VTGVYCQRIFLNELGAPPTSLRNAVPLMNFGK